MATLRLPDRAALSAEVATARLFLTLPSGVPIRVVFTPVSGVKTVRSRRLLTSIAALAVVATACASGGDREVQLQASGGDGPGVPLELVQQETPEAIDPDALIATTAAEIEMVEVATSVVLDAVTAECAANNSALQRPSADLSNRTFIGPEDLRCAQLRDASFENARIEDVDFSGASLAGANLRNARLSIVAVGVDFTGADLTGADLRGSDLTGAVFNSATIVDTDFTELVTIDETLASVTVGGMTQADFVSARLGCSEFEASPLVRLANVQFDDTCGDLNVDGRDHVTFTGSLLGADLSGLDFSRILIELLDLRGTNLQNASFAGYGVLPAGLGLVSADLVGADLSAVNIRNSWLVGAKLGNADLSGSLIEESTFARADLSGTDMSSVTSEHNDYRSAVVSGTNFSNSLLSWDDFSGAVFSNVITDELVVVALVCDGSGGEEVANGNSVRNFGLCTAGSELIF